MCSNDFPCTRCLICGDVAGPSHKVKLNYTKCAFVYNNGLQFGACGQRKVNETITDIAKCNTCVVLEERAREEAAKAEEEAKRAEEEAARSGGGSGSGSGRR